MNTKQHLIPIGCIALHVLICLVLLPQYKYCMEADFFSYLSIAQKYATGDFYHAINPYWSPFFSWLMTPLVLLDLPVHFIFKYFFMLFGVGIIWQFHKLLREQEVPAFVRLAGTASVAVFSSYFTLYYSMPDIIVVYAYLLYFTWHKGLFEDRRTAIITGLIAGFCFFIKAYSLPFFVLYSMVLIGTKWLIDNDLTRDHIKNFGIYFAIMLIVSSFWIIPLSLKYGGPTMGRSGAFNYHMKMNAPYTKQLGYPYEFQLLPLPNPTAYSYWEDPSIVNDRLKQNSKSNLKIQVFVTAQNIFALGRSVNYYNPFFFLIVIVLFVVLLRGLLARALIFKRELITATLFVGIYPSGYLLLFINERYQWVIFIFVLYISVLLFSEVAKKLALTRWEQLIAGLGFFLITAYAPADRTQVIYRRVAPPQKADMAKSLEIKQIIPSKAKIAYDRHWGKGLLTSVMNDNRFHGVFGIDWTDDKVIADLQKYQVEYLVLYTDRAKTLMLPYVEQISPPDFTPGIYKINLDLLNN